MEPASTLKKEDVLIQVRDKLRKRSIKLWLKPYYDENSGPSHDALKIIADEFSKALSISLDDCYAAILDLQNNSLENLKQNARFKESGLATIKIKLLLPNGNSRMITKELSLSMTVTNLKQMIAQEVNLTCDRLKLIGSGKVLNDSNTLNAQGVKNGQRIMSIVLPESPTVIKESEARFQEVENIKTDSRLLALDDQYMQLEDQFGNPIHIPKEEKKALMVAMALYEKGRKALKQKEYSNALVFFLEADEEFRRCNSKLLESVDNYALLNLDVVWCYLNLQSVPHLPEAYDRLKSCEERFQKSYGLNLERLIETKGGTGNEAIFLMRLHLLQGIVLYHQNSREEAHRLFKKAQEEIACLKVDENSVLLLAELGFSIPEARLGLRVHRGDLSLAENYIREQREKKESARKKAIADRILDRKRKKLGKCADGKQYVDPNFINILVNMGYNWEAARVALQKTNNIITDSVQYIAENPLPGPSQSVSQEMLALIEDLVPELEAAGFDARMAKLALHKFNGDIMKAAEELLKNHGIIEGDLPDLDAAAASKKSDLDEKRRAEKEEAFKRLTENITVEDEDYLDPALVQEELYLNQYLSLLENK